MHGSKDEIIRRARADLIGGLGKVSAWSIEVCDHSRRPGCGREFRREELWRPAAKKNRPPSHAVRQPWKPARHIRPPRQTPDFCPQTARVDCSRRRWVKP